MEDYSEVRNVCRVSDKALNTGVQGIGELIITAMLGRIHDRGNGRKWIFY